MPPRGKPDLILPEVLDPEHRHWRKHQVEIRQSEVDLENAVAYVPPAFTPAQQLARLHELAHVKYTPKSWTTLVTVAMEHAEANGETIDPGVALRIGQMLEENRIDWILWRSHGIDLRPAREVLDWDGMPVPDTTLEALEWVLQLAWTVWASRGLGALPKAPPQRDPDPDTAEFFDKCWNIIQQDPQGRNISVGIVNACRSIYEASGRTGKQRAQTTRVARDKAAAELAVFFPPKKQEQPDEKDEEKEEQKRAEEQKQNEEQAKERAKEEDEAGGIGNPAEQRGTVQVHDHTAGIRRPSVRVARRSRPFPIGTRVEFPERALLDGQIFGRRTLSQAGIMIDISGSMLWTNDNLREVINVMPAVSVAVYGGFSAGLSSPARGRICVLAKKGRFCRYEGKDPGFTGGNEIDIEALQFLSRWPGPRLWLSDGYVSSSRLHKIGHPQYRSIYLAEYGRAVYECDKLMKRYNILRVPDVATMLNLVKRRSVTVYRSSVNWTGMLNGLNADLMGRGKPPVTPDQKLRVRRAFYPDQMREEPMRFQL